MILINYKQLLRRPPGTIFSSLNILNEASELWIIRERSDGTQVLYSPMASLSGLGNDGVDFKDNRFDRHAQFMVWDSGEIAEYAKKVLALLDPPPVIEVEEETDVCDEVSDLS